MPQVNPSILLLEKLDEKHSEQFGWCVASWLLTVSCISASPSSSCIWQQCSGFLQVQCVACGLDQMQCCWRPLACPEPMCVYSQMQMFSWLSFAFSEFQLAKWLHVSISVLGEVLLKLVELPVAVVLLVNSLVILWVITYETRVSVL